MTFVRVCFFCLIVGNGCVQQDMAALPKDDGLKRLAQRLLVISYLDQRFMSFFSFVGMRKKSFVLLTKMLQFGSDQRTSIVL